MTIKKVLSVYVDSFEHQVLQRRASEVGIPLCRLVYEWLKPHIDSAKKQQGFDDRESESHERD